MFAQQPCVYNSVEKGEHVQDKTDRDDQVKVWNGISSMLDTTVMRKAGVDGRSVDERSELFI